MTKAEFIKFMSSKIDYMTKEQVDRAVRGTLSAIITGLHGDNRIEIRNFGCFSVKYFAPRQGINPKTGNKIDLPARKKVQFKAGKKLKDRVNNQN